MANELFEINNLKENNFEFDLVAEGLGAEDIKATLVIESKGIELGFPCTKNTEGKWCVKIPPLPMLERTVYPFHLRVVAEGYHFRPLKGSLNVVGSVDLYVQNATTKIESPIVREKKVEIKEHVKPQKPLTTKRHEKSIEQIAKELLETHKIDIPKAPSTKSVPVEENKTKASEPTKKPAVSVNNQPTAFFPNLIVEAKSEKKGSKDEEALKILEEAGLKPKIKSKKKFSIKD